MIEYLNDVLNKNIYRFAYGFRIAIMRDLFYNLKTTNYEY